MSAMRRHERKVIRSEAQSPRRLPRDLVAKRKADETLKAAARILAEAQHVPAINSRQGLIEAGLIKAK